MLDIEYAAIDTIYENDDLILFGLCYMDDPKYNMNGFGCEYYRFCVACPCESKILKFKDELGNYISRDPNYKNIGFEYEDDNVIINEYCRTDECHSEELNCEECSSYRIKFYDKRPMMLALKQYEI